MMQRSTKLHHRIKRLEQQLQTEEGSSPFDERIRIFFEQLEPLLSSNQRTLLSATISAIDLQDAQEMRCRRLHTSGPGFWMNWDTQDGRLYRCVMMHLCVWLSQGAHADLNAEVVAAELKGIGCN